MMLRVLGTALVLLCSCQTGPECTAYGHLGPVESITLTAPCGISRITSNCKAKMQCSPDTTSCTFTPVGEESCVVTLVLGNGETVTGTATFRPAPCYPPYDSRWNGRENFQGWYFPASGICVADAGADASFDAADGADSTHD